MSELRPSFEERDRYLDLLSTAYADGRIDEVEFRRRSDGVLEAVTHSDAIAQFEGLPRPNVLPVPYPPPSPSAQPRPPAAFGHLPPPPAVRSGPSTSRRTALIVGGGALLLGGLVASGVASMSPSPYVAPDPMESFMADPVWVDEVVAVDPYEWSEWVSRSADIARDLGLDGFSMVKLTTEGLVALVSAERAAGVATELTYYPDGSYSHETPLSHEVEHRVPLEQVEQGLGIAIQDASGHLAGEVTQAELVFSASGQPQYLVTVSDGSSTGSVTFDVDGNLVSVEEMG